MIGNMFKHIFMIDKGISVTFELIKLDFSGSDQMPLNTLQCDDTEWNTDEDTHFLVAV